jgi:hypothetical protein
MPSSPWNQDGFVSKSSCNIVLKGKGFEEAISEGKCRVNCQVNLSSKGQLLALPLLRLFSVGDQVDAG